MIQRIQTVYLFFVFCLMAIIIFFPFSSSWTVSLDAGIVAVLSLIAIFTYKKRKLQIKICFAMLYLLILAYLLHIYFNYYSLSISEIPFTLIFPTIAGIFIYLAILGIKKDERLVRSLDRLR